MRQNYEQTNDRRQLRCTFSAPHISTVSSSGVTTIRKYGVWKSSFSALPISLFLQPVNNRNTCPPSWTTHKQQSSVFTQKVARMFYLKSQTGKVLCNIKWMQYNFEKIIHSITKSQCGSVICSTA